MATEENWEDILRTNYTELLKNISTEFGLFGELKKARIFTPIALKSFMDCRDSTEKIDRMLRNLQKKDFESFKKFCEALNNSEQGHIVKKYLSKVQDVSCRQITTTDSPLNEDSAHNRAISDGMSECFKQHWNDLITEINFDEGLMSEVERRKIFTILQLNKLKDIESEMKRTEQMLSWLERGSEKQFLDFCEALKANNQPHTVKNYLRSKILEPSPLLIQTNPTQSHEIRRAPEGSSGPVPAEVNGLVPAEVPGKDFYFFPCSEEFLNDFKAKVHTKVAYRCESKPRGQALIMNNRFFTVDHLGRRDGSDVDTDNLKKLFDFLHFYTVVHCNKDAQEMWDILNEESKASHHKQFDMFVLFLMSHGIQGEIYGTDGKSLKTADIVNLFNGKNCPDLLTKPKLFFIQSCQGDVKTGGYMTTDAVMTACDSAVSVQHQNTAMEEMMRKLNLEEDFNMSIPLAPLPKIQSDAVADNKVHEMADMAIIYATVEGYVAWRRVDTGSLFVQCLVDILRKRAHETDLMRMITETFNMLHELEMVENQGRYKQIGEKRDSLRREVYLLPL